MQNLLLTLGHNSSAVLVRDGQVVCGYENERVTGVKSDSRFPVHAIEYMRKRGDLRGKIDAAYVSHWDPTGLLSSMKSKYWDPSYFDGVPIRTLGVDRTHHDAHMAAAVCYAGAAFPYADDCYGIVCDGFGILGEHFSVYKMSKGGERSLIKRVRGYDTSLGLWYQYATAFLGMKMHEDEYKMLGYEAHVNPQEAIALRRQAKHRADLMVEAMHKPVKFGDPYDPLISLDALTKTRELVWSHLADVAHRNGVRDSSSFEGRVKLAFYVQSVLELVVLQMIDEHRPKNVILTGGVFHNVKLNRLVMDHVDGLTCVMPLCGDQGNGIGLYYMDNPQFMFPANLNWGQRDLRNVGVVDGMYTVPNEEMAYDLCTRYLESVGYVNLVRGAMEFGPRALCNTSTIALPTTDVVDRINHANDRNTVMPMAPVMDRATFHSMFENTKKPWRSERHMIMAMEYREHPLPERMGVAHCYEYPHRHQTGRPQVIGEGDALINKLLHDHGGVLINTSFNFHGKPIALDMEKVVENHNLQYRRNNSFATVVVKS